MISTPLELTQLTRRRYDFEEGQHDEVCGGILGATSFVGEPCSVIHSTNDNWLYIQYPTEDFCCKCSQNIGAVRSDWLTDSANYTGRVTVDDNGAEFGSGVAIADGWLKYGASDNHYYVDAANDMQRPVRYMEHKNDALKQWDFILATYESRENEWFSGAPPDLFAPPADCDSNCRSTMCSF